MYYLIALFTGVLITVMVAFNGTLTGTHGLYAATVIIHSVGLIVITALLVFKRESPFSRESGTVPLHLYLGGAVGVISVLLTNFAFASLSVSALLAMGLFGQTLSGIVIDNYGLFGMAKHPFGRHKWAGLTLMLLGVGIMAADLTGRAAVVAAVLAVSSGASISLGRVFNARLAENIGTRRGIFFNYVIGLVVSIPLLILLGRQEAGIYFSNIVSPQFYIYLGGFIGVCVILLDNKTAVRLPAFYLPLLLFIGQVSAGLVADWVIEQAITPQNILGGVLVALGLGLNVWLERYKKR